MVDAELKGPLRQTVDSSSQDPVELSSVATSSDLPMLLSKAGGVWRTGAGFRNDPSRVITLVGAEIVSLGTVRIQVSRHAASRRSLMFTALNKGGSEGQSPPGLEFTATRAETMGVCTSRRRAGPGLKRWWWGRSHAVGLLPPRSVVYRIVTGRVDLSEGGQSHVRRFLRGTGAPVSLIDDTAQERQGMGERQEEGVRRDPVSRTVWLCGEGRRCPR